ncbi:LuxR C-terminal-related transcriptional regulator [Brevibacillus panacihumi]|nr:LuxR C-terminal-related transcriptional regulator [Brevibacillus panacihumi]
MNKNKTAFDFSRLRNSFALSKGQYGRTKIVLNSIAMPIYKQNQLLGYIGLISEKEVKGMEPVIELLSKLISDQIMMENSTFRQKFESISEVEMEILELIFLGKTDDEIAKTIQFSKSTVRFYISKLFKKFKVKKRIELSNIYNELNSSRMKKGDSHAEKDNHF